MSWNIADCRRALGALGWKGCVQLFISRRRLRKWMPKVSQISVRGNPYPFHYRPGTTDKFVIRDVFVIGQYVPLSQFTNVEYIIDGGANIGAASVALLNAFKEASLLAIEPDPGNFAVLTENLARYGQRAHPIHSAIWHESGPLALDRGNYRGGRRMGHSR